MACNGATALTKLAAVTSLSISWVGVLASIGTRKSLWKYTLLFIIPLQGDPLKSQSSLPSIELQGCESLMIQAATRTCPYPSWTSPGVPEEESHSGGG